MSEADAVSFAESLALASDDVGPGEEHAADPSEASELARSDVASDKITADELRRYSLAVSWLNNIDPEHIAPECDRSEREDSGGDVDSDSDCGDGSSVMLVMPMVVVAVVVMVIVIVIAVTVVVADVCDGGDSGWLFRDGKW